MTGVELPDYGMIYGILIGVITVAVAAWIRKGTPSKKDNGLLKILENLLRAPSCLESTNDQLEAMKKRALSRAQAKPGKLSTRLAMWNLRSHLKEDVDLCGFIKPGEWQCRCGKAQCETFGKLCEAVGGVDATPPVQPLPDRKAAIAHTKAKP